MVSYPDLKKHTADNIDTVIWMGDFNYRIGLAYDEAKQLIKQGNYDRLYENDQVIS